MLILRYQSARDYSQAVAHLKSSNCGDSNSISRELPLPNCSGNEI